jgi:LacI family transcriptional regulator
VLGYDDFKLISENTVPALTAVSLPYYKMGKRAAEMALDMVANKTSRAKSVRMRCEIVKRDSDRVIRRRAATGSAS